MRSGKRSKRRRTGGGTEVQLLAPPPLLVLLLLVVVAMWWGVGSEQIFGRSFGSLGEAGFEDKRGGGEGGLEVVGMWWQPAAGRASHAKMCAPKMTMPQQQQQLVLTVPGSI